MKHHKVIIIGSGPAGLMAAYAAGSGALILERNSIAGKKILLSGSGQCNLSNNLNKDQFLSRFRELSFSLKPALYAFDNKSFTSLLEQYGCPCQTRDDGKIFPQDRKSVRVRDALLEAVKASGADIMYDCRIDSVAKTPDGIFILSGPSVELSCDRLILATGGKSWPQTGSDGLGYQLASSLGHKINKLRPALAALSLAKADPFTACAGLSMSNVTVTFCGSSGRINDCGDLIFTHEGLSGPVILNNSYLMKPGDNLALCLVPDAESKLLDLCKKDAKKQLATAMKHLDLSSSLIQAVLTRLEINPTQTMAELSATDRKLIGRFLQMAVFKIKAIEALESSMATSGGINPKEINFKTMESRRSKGLYFAGEMIDYHAPSGGFNIQMAASTGYLAGKSASS